jgi:hypothetical protein
MRCDAIKGRYDRDREYNKKRDAEWDMTRLKKKLNE